jgi:hypothetical protein
MINRMWRRIFFALLPFLHQYLPRTGCHGYDPSSSRRSFGRFSFCHCPKSLPSATAEESFKSLVPTVSRNPFQRMGLGDADGPMPWSLLGRPKRAAGASSLLNGSTIEGKRKRACFSRLAGGEGWASSRNDLETTSANKQRLLE